MQILKRGWGPHFLEKAAITNLNTWGPHPPPGTITHSITTNVYLAKSLQRVGLESQIPATHCSALKDTSGNHTANLEMNGISRK